MSRRVESNHKKHRVLYRLFLTYLRARAYKYGIKIHQVTPKYTSIIGRVNYSYRYGLSTHLAAALCIARRYQKFSETPCSPEGKLSDGKGGHIALFYLKGIERKTYGIFGDK